MSWLQKTPEELIRAQSDLLAVYNDRKMYINEKGYLQKLIDMLFKTGYYRDNESIFSIGE